MRRQELPRRRKLANVIDWKAALWAGIVAGFVFMVLEMLLVQLVGGGSMWGPPRMMAAMVMGRGVLPPPATFDPNLGREFLATRRGRLV